MGGMGDTDGDQKGGVFQIWPHPDAIVEAPIPIKPNWKLRIGLGLAAIGLTGAGLYAASRSSEVPTPELLISGPIPGANPDADVQGAVDLNCYNYGGQAVVNATVYLVTTREKGGSERGRIVQSQQIFDDPDCASAFREIIADPTEIFNDVVSTTEAVVVENFVGDGNFNAGDKYATAIEKAREAGVPEIAIEMRG